MRRGMSLACPPLLGDMAAILRPPLAVMCPFLVPAPPAMEACLPQGLFAQVGNACPSLVPSHLLTEACPSLAPARLAGEASPSLVPSPLVGEGQGEGYRDCHLARGPTR